MLYSQILVFFLYISRMMFVTDVGHNYRHDIFDFLKELCSRTKQSAVEIMDKCSMRIENYCIYIREYSFYARISVSVDFEVER